MTRCAYWVDRGIPLLAAVGFLTLLLATGCGKSGPASVDGPVAADANLVQESPPSANRLHQSFAEATLAEPPGYWHRPPDLTLTGKSVGKLYSEVVRLWDEVKFTSADGKPLAYRAIIDTVEGTVEIALRADWAPNHVRSFIALARVGYYDGLVFERAIRGEIPGRAGDKLEIIEAGCPLGTGESGHGSIGYWLKPEIHPAGVHDVGAVGACHGEEADTSACKFYISLNKAPFLDGGYTVFGQVTNGLDVARRILEQPLRTDAEFPEGDRPVKPVVIRKVTIVVDADQRAQATARATH